MAEKQIIYIAAEHIRPHPKNPRKDLGDLTELSESIKKNGILQNLTVIPVEGEPGEYMTIIGHRRYAAGTQAGVAEFPCQIAENLTPREQMSIMLEENMQRNDLTIWEQANGFQMMLDLGETEESIAEKTGFSKTTVKHRLNIAKLNQKVLQEKEKDEGFQLSLKDLYALEQVEDIKIRDKILKEASNSRDLAWKAKSAAEEIKREKVAAEIIAMLKAVGIEPAPEQYEKDMYSGKWETLETYSLEKAAPKRIVKKKLEGGGYYKSYREVRIVKKKDKSKEPVSEYERQRKEKEKNAKAIKVIAKEMAAQRESFIRNVLSGKIEPLKDTEKVMAGLWRAIVYANGYVGKTSLAKFLADTKKSWYDIPDEDKKKAMEELEKTSTLHQLMIGAYVSTSDLVYTDYNNHYKEETGKAVTAITEALSEYGFSYSDDEQNKVMEGSHEFYVKEESHADSKSE